MTEKNAIEKNKVLLIAASLRIGGAEKVAADIGFRAETTRLQNIPPASAVR